MLSFANASSQNIFLLEDGAKFKDKPSVLSEDVYTLEKGEEFIVDHYEDSFLKGCTRISNKCGYVSGAFFVKSEKFKSFIKSEIFANFNQKQIDSKKKEEEVIHQLVLKSLETENLLKKKYGEKVYSDLKVGKFWLGMTLEMAEIALGKPTKINESVGKWGNHQQWVYNNKILYFENGKLVSFQR